MVGVQAATLAAGADAMVAVVAAAMVAAQAGSAATADTMAMVEALYKSTPHRRQQQLYTHTHTNAQRSNELSAESWQAAEIRV